MADLISPRAYAELRGVSRQAVEQAIAEGRISVKKAEDGRALLDPDVADKEWDRNTGPSGKRDNMQGSGPTYSQSRAFREAYRAKLAELEFKEKSGKLVDADEVKKKWSQLIAITRNKILGIPSKAKSQIPHLGIDEIGVLDELVREALNEIADGSE